jgi:hypothetical protein
MYYTHEYLDLFLRWLFDHSYGLIAWIDITTAVATLIRNMEYYPDTLHMRAYIAGGFSEPPSASVGDLVIWLLIFLKKNSFLFFYYSSSFFPFSP